MIQKRSNRRDSLQGIAHGSTPPRSGTALAEKAGIEPATDGFIRPVLVLKTRWNTSSFFSVAEPQKRCAPADGV
jgi:hypothetical protein